MSRSSRFLLLAIALCAASCARRSVEKPSNQTPVILISIDTLRSDHLPAYGYKGIATPNIDALRKDSILFERAYSNVPLTLPSHISILTGLLPGQNGVRDNVGFRLADNVPMVQELLKKNGYATGAAVSAFVLRRETGTGRGFDFFDDLVKPVNGETLIARVQRTAGETWRAAQSWLDAQGGKPFFLFLHFYDPHTPYEPPEPFFSRYENHYDGEIAYTDAVIGDVIADLKQRNLYDKALIILVSDHGEGLGDHGEREHGIFVYRESLQVPLIVKLPRSAKAGSTVATPVQLIDVFPTILDLTATPLPANGGQKGQSLLAFADGGAAAPVYSETYYPLFHFGWSDLHSLIDGNDHYIRAPQPELYDLASDPGEKTNTLEQNRRAYTKLRAAIEPFVTAAKAPTNIDREEAAKLAALGYVGSTVSVAPGQSLPDPKTKIDVYADIERALGLFHKGKIDESFALTNRLLADNKQLTDLWDLKAKILWQEGHRKEAIDAAKEGLHHIPNSVALLYDVASLSLSVGDIDTAEKHAEIAVMMEPGEAHIILAKVALRRGDEARAEREAKAAVGTAHDPTDALSILAGLAKERGDLQQALAYCDQAVAAAPRGPGKHPGMHAQRGDILARLGRTDEAEKEFRAEIENTPGAPQAYASLVMLLATQRRLDEATKVVLQMVQNAPQPHTYAIVADTLVAIGDERGAMYWAYQGLQRYPNNAELRALPEKVRKFAPAIRKKLGSG